MSFSTLTCCYPLILLIVILFLYKLSKYTVYEKEQNARAAGENLMSSASLRHNLEQNIVFSVAMDNGIPPIAQFRRYLPDQIDSYRFVYSTEFHHDFAFEARRRPSDAYDVLIRRCHPYGSRPSSGHNTHRYDVGGINERICFAIGVEPYDLPDACRKAVLWADATSLYITTGEPWE